MKKIKIVSFESSDNESSDNGSSNNKSAAYQSGIKKKCQGKATTELRSAEYVSLLGFKGGSSVQVSVGRNGELYKIPKALLCQHSEYFRGMFDGGPFPEAETLKTSLEFMKPSAFEDVLQWIATGKIVTAIQGVADLPPSEVRPHEDAYPDRLTAGLTAELVMKHKVIRLQLSQYLEFLLAADYLLVAPDPAYPIVAEMETLLRKMSHEREEPADPFTHKILRKVFQLPSTHPARKFVGQVCVDSYLYTRVDDDGDVCLFPYEAEIESVPGFGMLLLNAVTKAVSHPQCTYTDGSTYAAGDLEEVAVRTPVLHNMYKVHKKEWDELEKAKED